MIKHLLLSSPLVLQLKSQNVTYIRDGYSKTNNILDLGFIDWKIAKIWGILQKKCAKNLERNVE